MVLQIYFYSAWEKYTERELQICHMSFYVLNTCIPPQTTSIHLLRCSSHISGIHSKKCIPSWCTPRKGFYIKNNLLFVYNSNLAGHPVFLFVKSGSCTQEVLIISQFVQPMKVLLSLQRHLTPSTRICWESSDTICLTTWWAFGLSAVCRRYLTDNMKMMHA